MEAEVERTRERVIRLLGTYYARGAYEMEEYERLVDEAHRLASRRELEQMIDRLPMLPASPRADVSSLQTDPAASMEAQGRGSRSRTVINIFSGTSRRGAWLPAPVVNVVNVFGGVDLDFREAQLPPGGVTVRVFCLFGGADIVVDERVDVAVEGFGLFGGFDSKVSRGEYRGAPTVRVTGFCLFGAVDVKRKLRK